MSPNAGEGGHARETSIGDEHRYIKALFGRLMLSMQRGEGRESAAAIAVELEAYARDHFAHEEALMQRAAYARATEHAAVHEEMRARLAELVAATATQSARSLELLQFLSRWLEEHFADMDAELIVIERRP